MLRLPAKYLVVALLIWPSSPGFSQTEGEEKVIIPIAIANAPGANGTVWNSGTWGYNPTTETIDARFPSACPVGCGNGGFFAAQESHFLLLVPAPIGRPGRILFFKKGQATLVKIVTTLSESRQMDVSPGVSIAPVYESDLFTGPMHIVNFRTNPNFRLRLRLYSPDNTAAGSFRLRLYSMYTQALLFDGTVLLSPADSEFSPAYGEFSDFPTSDDPIRAQIDPVTPGIRYWAFVSATSNESEAINIALPSKP